MAIVTASGTLVTLLFGLSAISTSQKNFKIPKSLPGTLEWSLVFFLVAVLLALATNLPLYYRSVSATEFSQSVKTHWNETTDAARIRITATRLAVLSVAKTRNELKAWILAGAMGADLVALVFVGIAVAEILRHSPIR